MREVLSEATEAGGYMEMPLTKDDTLTGGANDLYRVYDRGGEVCPRCGDTIVKSELNGRKAFYSPGCQHDR
ncbi:Endonuclease 8 [compost metagenome]